MLKSRRLSARSNERYVPRDEIVTEKIGTETNMESAHWIKAGACLPLLLHQLAKTGQDKFAVLFNLFVA
jgi:hypothetical protein